MSFLPTYERSDFRNIAVDAYNDSAAVPVATDAGSGLGAFFDGDSLVAVVQQRQSIYLSLIARLASIPANPDGSPNPDVDSFCSPFIGPRLGQSYATGPALFSCASAVATQLVVLVGTTIAAVKLTYTVVADPTNEYSNAYSALLGGYPINPGQTSVTATVQCTTPGILGNAQIGQINTLLAGPGIQGVPAGVTSVSNPAAFISGAPYESDAQYKARFTLRMSTGQGGTLNAMSAALLGIASGVTYAIADCKDANGNPVSSYFTAVVALLGQSGATTANLISLATAALEGNPTATPPVLPTRPAGITYQVIGPTILTVNVAATVKVAPGYVSATVQQNCVTAVQEYINGIGLPGLAPSSTLAYGKIFSILYAVPGVLQVDALLFTEGGVNSAADLVATFAQLFNAGAMTFTMTS